MEKGLTQLEYFDTALCGDYVCETVTSNESRKIIE